MVRTIIIVALLGGAGFAGWYFLIKKKGLEDLQGYPDAKSAQEVVDLFKKAVENREYEIAAKYCTQNFAEQLRKAGKPAKELAVAIDELQSRLKDSGVSTGEMELILFWHDPLPKSIKMTPEAVKDTEATAVIQITDSPALQSDPKGTWKIDRGFVKGLYSDLPAKVKLVKEGDVWKIDFPVTPATRSRVDRVTQKAKDYKIAFDKLAGEVKRDATTKEDARKRMQELVDEATTAER